MKTATVDVLLREDGVAIGYNKAFQNTTVLGMFLIKSEEWIFPIYRTDNAEKLSGFIYEGDKLTYAQISEVINKYAPKFLSQYSDYKTKLKGKVRIHTLQYESFQIIADYNGREILQKNDKQES